MKEFFKDYKAPNSSRTLETLTPTPKQSILNQPGSYEKRMRMRSAGGLGLGGETVRVMPARGAYQIPTVEWDDEDDEIVVPARGEYRNPTVELDDDDDELLFDHTPSRPSAYTGFCLVYVQETLWGIKPVPLLLSAVFLLAMYRFL
jgi:hypothetical protein